MFRLCGDDFFDDVAHQRDPSAQFEQLRRGCPNVLKTLANIGDHRLDLIPCTMHRCE